MTDLLADDVAADSDYDSESEIYGGDNSGGATGDDRDGANEPDASGRYPCRYDCGRDYASPPSRNNHERAAHGGAFRDGARRGRPPGSGRARAAAGTSPRMPKVAGGLAEMPLQDRLAAGFGMVALGVGFFNEYDSLVLSRTTPELVGALMPLADEYPWLYAALELIANVGPWSAVAFALCRMVVPILANHGVVSTERVPAMLWPSGIGSPPGGKQGRRGRQDANGTSRASDEPGAGTGAGFLPFSPFGNGVSAPPFDLSGVSADDLKAGMAAAMKMAGLGDLAESWVHEPDDDEAATTEPATTSDLPPVPSTPRAAQ